MEGSQIMATQIYKVRDPSGAIREIEGPEGATDDQVIAKAKELFAAPAPAAESMPAAPQQELTTGQKIYQAVRPYVEPTVTALGAVGGGLVGTPMGPLGAVGGAGLGYGMAKQAMTAADVGMGMRPAAQGLDIVAEPVKNVLEGATYETGGRVVAPLFSKAASAVMDLRQIPQQKAADIARNALAGDLPDVLNALRNAPAGMTAAQATANITNPTWQALIQSRLAADPKFTLTLKNMNEQDAVNELTKLAGGVTATDVRASVSGAKDRLNALTTPMRDTALARANLGQDVAELEARAGSLSEQAASAVADVRRLVNAGNVAEAAARLELIKKGLPVGFTQYTYKGQLGKMADEWASQAANASLDLGQGARFAQGAADSLRSVGIKPLNAPALVAKIQGLAAAPGYAGNDIMSTAVKNVADDIAKWTTSGGLIDAVALDAIRKNSVNAAIRQLNLGADATTQRNLAASVMSKLKPVIDDALISAGGTGYKDYLATYAKGAQKIAEQKLSGKALELFQTNKDAFVKLVEGNAPQEVEKILGPGSYNIAKDVSENTLNVLRDQATKVVREANIKTQVTEGQDALKELLTQHISKLRLPSYINVYAATGNRALGILENKIGTKTMRALTEAFKTPQGTADLLNTLPANERSKVLQLISDPSKWRGVGPSVVNALTPQDTGNEQFNFLSGQ
jgi:hypothetical protein